MENSVFEIKGNKFKACVLCALQGVVNVLLCECFVSSDVYIQCWNLDLHNVSVLCVFVCVDLSPLYKRLSGTYSSFVYNAVDFCPL